MPPKKTTGRGRGTSDLEPQTDPRAPIDGARLLAAARPVLKLLGEDLLERARSSPAVTSALMARHEAEKAARRTADAFPVWQSSFVDQVAAAWFLSCVFARTLEDRGLVSQARLAGPGAADSQHLFLELAPSLTERDYLLTTFRELARFPAARDLFDARHNPVWLLTPSAEAAKALLALFRAPGVDTPAFRFGQPDTRFLGDLYQDLNADVKERYALLQTPRFVESFILDRTLERAIQTFGLDDTTLIDPTCGSGHFLLGAFDRLFDHRLRNTPGIDAREAARKALDAVYGSDINPYAVAIARFRLTLAYLDKAGYTKIADAPALPLHLVVADSLLHNPQAAQSTFAEMQGQTAKSWSGEEFALEDETAARDVLHRRFAAVVGNPPYITVKDAVLRERYRAMYSSAHREYSLAVPFCERFFLLAREDGAVGMITSNSFMKREFGKRLIENFLPTVNLDLIANTSGAYIPGHGTPTVLLFGTATAPKGLGVSAVLAKRGEPSTPDDPEQGLVWRSIADHWQDDRFENEYISTALLTRESLGQHPWSLGGGGANELKSLLEQRSAGRLSDQVTSIGFMAITKQDDVFCLPRGAFARLGVPASWIKEFVIGELVRDWAVSEPLDVFFPYELNGTTKVLEHDAERALWPYRTVLGARAVFGGETFAEAGKCWYEYGQIPKDRIAGPAISFPFVATHNHFILDRGGKVFNRTAPIIKLPETATEDDHLALLAYLNSSTACFWMKQVFQPKGNHTDDRPEKGIPDWDRYEFAGTGMLELPLPNPSQRAHLLSLGSELSALAERRNELAPSALLATGLVDRHHARDYFDRKREEDARIEHRMVVAQEDTDWLTYTSFGLCDSSLAGPMSPSSSHIGDARPFLGDQPPASLSEVDRDLWLRRKAAISAIPAIRFIETLMFKRKWMGAGRGSFALKVMTYEERAQVACRTEVLTEVERALENGTAPMSAAALLALCAARVQPFAQFAELGQDAAEAEPFRELLAGDAVPYLDALRYTGVGMLKRAEWKLAWAAQRAEDDDPSSKPPAVPPKYDQVDYADIRFFRLRGKLDVPKERFISYPGCESDEDKEPVYGWAGWNHLQQAQALAALYQKRKTEEAWGADRLTPMLAGLLELLPWVKQWHNEPSAEYNDMRLGDFFETFIDGECQTLGLTHDDLRAWRPADKTRAARAKTTKAAAPKKKKAHGEEGA